MNRLGIIAGYSLAGAIALGGMVAVVWWFSIPAKFEIALRLALQTHERAPTQIVEIDGEFTEFDGVPSAIKDGWPQFRGPNRDNIAPASVPLLDSWPDEGPPVLWSIELGDGYAGAAVKNGRVYVLDYDEDQQADALRVFSLDDGAEIWRRSYEVSIKRNHGMSRTVPAVTDDFVVTIGPMCQVMAADAVTGEFLWGIDLPNEYGTQVPLWYAGQCPLIDDDIAVIATGGAALLIGVNCATGEVLWETPNPYGWQMSHSSITLAVLAGKRMYIYTFAGGMAGISAEADDQGELLWSTTEWDRSIMAPSPVQISNNEFIVTAGYGGGGAIFRVDRDGDEFTAVMTKEFTRREFASEQHTPIYYRDHIFTVMPADAGALRLQALCIDRDGEIAWSSGMQHRFGIGPYLIADEKMFILDDDGELTMLRAGTERFEKLGSFRPLQGPDAWGPMALVDGRLILRDFTRMICLDLRRE